MQFYNVDLCLFMSFPEMSDFTLNTLHETDPCMWPDIPLTWPMTYHYFLGCFRSGRKEGWGRSPRAIGPARAAGSEGPARLVGQPRITRAEGRCWTSWAGWNSRRSWATWPQRYVTCDLITWPLWHVIMTIRERVAMYQNVYKCY